MNSRRCSKSWPSLLQTRGGLRAVLVLISVAALTACSASPSRNILGSYFPTWMICALLGLVVVVVLRALLGKARRRRGASGSGSRLSVHVDCRDTGDLAAVAGMKETPRMSEKTILGRIIALVAIASAIVMLIATMIVLDQRPRTHDAYVFAYSAGITPEVSGRIVESNIQNDQFRPPRRCTASH